MLEVEKEGWITEICLYCGAKMIMATRSDKSGNIPLDPKAPIFYADNFGSEGPTALQIKRPKGCPNWRRFFVSHFATCPAIQRAAKSLSRIKEIIEAVDNRCACVDGPVSKTLDEMEQAEISEIYRLAKGSK